MCYNHSLISADDEKKYSKPDMKTIVVMPAIILN